jgi:SAM-dependent methyltransferase
VSGPLDCPCEGRYLEVVHTYEAPPEGETRFSFADDGYRRAVERCRICDHFVSRHAMAVDGLYEGGYVDATYGDRLRQAFERILALPPELSDNAGRVARVLAFASQRLGERPATTVLDVGSGLCVFLARLEEAGWIGTALDPDPRAAEHARSVVGVSAVDGDYLAVEGLGRFDVVAFNKVLEHVEDPVAMLARAAGSHVAPGGFVYVEVPDGPAAAAEGFGREEFFIEHRHVFSPASLAQLAARAGLSPLRIERLREPSTKYTLAAFLEPAPTWIVSGR